jgi:hypothetical protein
VRKTCGSLGSSGAISIGGGKRAAGLIEQETAPAFVILVAGFKAELNGTAAEGIGAAAVVVDRKWHGGGPENKSVTKSQPISARV